MTLVTQVFTQASFSEHGDETFDHGKQAIAKHLPEMQALLIQCSEKESCPPLSVEEKNNITAFIVERTANAYFGSQIKWFREDNTGKKGKKYTANSFRPHLASICKTSAVTDKKKLEATEKRKRQRN